MRWQGLVDAEAELKNFDSAKTGTAVTVRRKDSMDLHDYQKRGDDSLLLLLLLFGGIIVDHGRSWLSHG